MFVKLEECFGFIESSCMCLFDMEKIFPLFHLLGEVFIAQPGNRSESTEIVLKNVPF